MVITCSQLEWLWNKALLFPVQAVESNKMIEIHWALFMLSTSTNRFSHFKFIQMSSQAPTFLLTCVLSFPGAYRWKCLFKNEICFFFLSIPAHTFQSLSEMQTKSHISLKHSRFETEKDSTIMLYNLFNEWICLGTGKITVCYFLKRRFQMRKNSRIPVHRSPYLMPCHWSQLSAQTWDLCI